MLDKTIYDRILKEVPTFKFISQSILIERLKINGSLARVAIRHLEKEGTIKRIVHHSSQLIYSPYPFSPSTLEAHSDSKTARPTTAE